MRFEEMAPAGWDQRIAFPVQSVGFAQAARALGYRPLFAEDDNGLALVLVRRVPIPLLAAWTGRAKVYAQSRQAGILPALVRRLAALGVSYVKLGDWIWGNNEPLPDDWRGLRRFVHHSFVIDVRVPSELLLQRVKGTLRRHIRTATAEVTVAEVRTAADLRDYLSLVAQTVVRMRDRDQAAVYPAAYFEAILREMAPRGQAVLMIARAGEVPLAGAVFLTSRERFVHIHGCSTRDRALTPKQGPTAIFWHAMRVARARGCALLDMGAVTPTEDPEHPHHSVYTYKRSWGGQLQEIPGVELVLSAWKNRFQEFVLAPLWDRLHPLYLRFVRRGADIVAAANPPGPEDLTGLPPSGAESLP